MVNFIKHPICRKHCLSPDEEGPINLNPAVFILCRKMPCSGQRRHQSLRHQQSQLAATPPRLPAAAPPQPAQLWLLSGPLRQLSRRAATPLRRLLLPVETMMVTLRHTRAQSCTPEAFLSGSNFLCVNVMILLFLGSLI